MPYTTLTTALALVLVVLMAPTNLHAETLPDRPYLSTIAISEPTDELVGSATVLYFSPTREAAEVEAMEKTGDIIRNLGKVPIFVKTEEITSRQIVDGIGKSNFCRRQGGLIAGLQPLFIGVVVVWEKPPTSTTTLTKSTDTAVVIASASDVVSAKLRMIEKMRERQSKQVAAHGVYENSSTWEIPKDMELRIFSEECLAPA